MNDETPIIATVTVLVLAPVGALFWSPINGGDIPIGYPHEVTGTVTGEPTTRYVRSGDSGQEKVAITLTVEEPVSAPTLRAAVYGDTITVECLSTRCAQIRDGERHTLACRGAGRMLEPNVAVCKHVARL